jgi:Secretion system C-terminal sorting domain
VVNTNGDSLYFDFAFPTGVTLPPSSTSFAINHQTGVITWDAPNVICNYSIFVTMKYYRNISGLYYYIGTNMQEIYTDNTCISDMLVNELSNDSGVTIAPNPFSELTSITFSEEQKNTSLKVMNVLGECVHQSTINTSQCTIDMSGMPKGIYFVRIKTEKGIVNRKIIKN